MKTRLFLPISLLAVLLASACAPAAAPTQPAAPQPFAVEPSATAANEAAQPSVDLTATQIFTDSLLSATPPVDVMPVATSRGPDLHATDPTTVSLASGQLQFVEFFRFT